MRVILTADEADAEEALAALEADDSAKSFEQVAKEFSIDEATKSTGGLRQAVVEGQSEPALDAEIFAAPEGELVGPFEGDAGFYVIQVEKITPAATTPLEDASEQIRQTLVVGAPAGDRDDLPGGLSGQVGLAHGLRRRLSHRPLLECRAAARCLHRGGRRDPGLRCARRRQQADRARQRHRLRRSRARAAPAGSAHSRRRGTRRRRPAGPGARARRRCAARHGPARRGSTANRPPGARRPRAPHRQPRLRAPHRRRRPPEAEPPA